MKSNLLGTTTLDYQKKLLPFEQTAFEDLELHYLVDIMAEEDEFLSDTISSLLFQPSTNKEEITSRQESVQDALQNKTTIQQLYERSTSVIEEEKKGFWGRLENHPTFAVSHALKNIPIFIEGLSEIKEQRPKQLHSKAFRSFYDQLDANLTEEKKDQMLQLAKELKFKKGENIYSHLMLDSSTKPLQIFPYQPPIRGKIARMFNRSSNLKGYSFTIAERDESTFRNLSNFKERAEYRIAQELSRVNDSFLELFKSIRVESGFLLGVIRLFEKINHYPTCFPEISNRLSLKENHYMPLVLDRQSSVGNTLEGIGKLLVITGANQGGKTTFLKMLGQNQLLAQSGIFVVGEQLKIPIRQKIFTHFKQEEDEELDKGKLAEEMSRFSELLNFGQPNALFLFNESFASTNETEGSLISEEVVQGLIQAEETVVFVTHQYEFAEKMYEKNIGTFIRPSRSQEGERLYKMVLTEPKPTGYGLDIYQKIFGDEAN